MRVKINGKQVDEPVHDIEIKEEASDATGLVVVVIGAILCYGWWNMWQ